MTLTLPCVLAAEDEESDAYILQLAFEEARVLNPLVILRDGEEVVSYLSGAGQYADRLAHPLPGLITLDLKMPRMSGFDVLTWLRDQPQFGHIPVVVISSSSEDADMQAARRLGARDYFVKPHRLDDFTSIALALHEKWLAPARP